MFTLHFVIGSVSAFLVMVPLYIFLQILVGGNGRHKVTVTHVAGMYAFGLLLAGMLSVTGVPALANMQYRADTSVNLQPFVDINTNLIQYIQNVLLFIPFGFLLPLLWKKQGMMIKTVASGFLLSLAIEVSQLFNYRTTDIDDLIMNTLGAILGYLLYLAAGLLFPKCVEAFRLGNTEGGAVSWLAKHEGMVTIVASWLVVIMVQPYVSEWLWAFF